MTFFDSIKTVFRRYAEFEGRATRPEFWWFALFSALVSSALSALIPPTYMYGNFMAVNAVNVSAAPIINLAGFWSVVVFLPSLAVTIRRLRDAGHDWSNIFWILLPIAGLIVLIVKLADPTATATAAVVPAAPAAPAKAPAKAPAAPKAPPAPKA